MPAEPPGENAISSEHDVTATDGESPPNRELLGLVERSLDDDKALDPTVIDLAGKTTLADFMVVATGTNSRQLSAMADHLVEKLKTKGRPHVPVEGRGQGDWVLVDAGDVIVHLFRPDARAHYALEKMWQAEFDESASKATAGS